MDMIDWCICKRKIDTDVVSRDKLGDPFTHVSNDRNLLGWVHTYSLLFFFFVLFLLKRVLLCGSFCGGVSLNRMQYYWFIIYTAKEDNFGPK